MQNHRIYKIGIFLLVVAMIQSCSDFRDLNNIERVEEEVELAVPLINTEFLISDFTGENGPENVSIKVDEDDRVTLVYNGDVVQQDQSAVFPPIPLFAFPILDTVFTAPVPFASDQRVDRAVFGNSNLTLRFLSEFAENVDVQNHYSPVGKRWRNI